VQPGMPFPNLYRCNKVLVYQKKNRGITRWQFGRRHIFRGITRLGAGLVAGDEEEGGVHDGRAVEHGGHQNVVPGAVNKRDVAEQLHLFVLKARHLTLGIILLARAVGPVARWPGAGLVLALIDLCVGVPQLDCNVALQLILEPDRLHT
jgi:hypothetical protein